MSLVISPVEVDVLVKKIDSILRTFADAKNCAGWRVEKFEDYLINCRFNPEKPYGKFPTDTPIIKFFQGGHKAESRLTDIRAKNIDEGTGRIRVNGTAIELINYSVCPACSEIFSFKDLQRHFRDPPPIEGVERRAQIMNDPRMHCTRCGTLFVPSLVICCGSPRSEVQDLCRVQTVFAIEEFFFAQDKEVLTRNPKNIKVNEKGLRAIINDVYIDNLRERPTLIANLVKHTPPRLVPSFISAKNIPNKTLLFGLWM